MYLVSAAACLLFSANALDRHRAFESTAYDLGFFDQIIWNTSHGHWFETSFTPYNFVGQHVQPVLLIFALAYRLGAGIEFLLVTQTLFAAGAALPLFYAVRRATSSGVAALTMSLGFLFSASLHDALNFDFHPELMGFFFVFLALYYLVSDRPAAAVGSLVPLLLLKEDMALLIAAVAVVLFARGFRRAGLALLSIAMVYALAFVFVLMPLIRGGPGDLTQRYGYLFADSTWGSILPHALSRALHQLAAGPLAAALRLTESTGFLGFLSPIALLAAAPAFLLAALSNHPQQARFELQYAMAPLALTWVAVVLGLQRLAGWRSPSFRWRNRSLISATGGAFVLACSVATFVAWSPYAPDVGRPAIDATHRAALHDALLLVPRDAPISAQTTLLPHLSHREAIFEFPELHQAAYVVVDRSLPITSQSRDAGYDGAIETLANRGYELLFDRDGVQVFRRTP